jgi:hypothetical protein
LVGEAWVGVVVVEEEEEEQEEEGHSGRRGKMIAALDVRLEVRSGAR